MLLACVNVITTLFAYYKKTNNSRTEIVIEKRFIIFNDLSNKTKSILGVRCTLSAYAASSISIGSACLIKYPLHQMFLKTTTYGRHDFD